MTPTRPADAQLQPATSPLADRFARVRAASLAIAAPLSAEDCQAQSMPDASPVKWHLAHTTWFWETFVLAEHSPGHVPFDPAFQMLFNSYYNGVGDQFSRPARGLLTRPSLDRVRDWRAHVDEGMARLLAGTPSPELGALVELGLAHEEQHQELMLTDLKHLLAANPLMPAYAGRWPLSTITPQPRSWVPNSGGLVEMGAEGGFAFDNEQPRHRAWLEPFELATHPVTNGDWIAFIEDGGYRRPELWLSAGWETCRAEAWTAPMYWRETEGGWRCFTLHGDSAVDPHAPVTHISFYEAEAFARWAGARLPTEAEWEAAAAGLPVSGNFADSGALHPLAATRPATPGQPAQMFGDVWEWTRSDYQPYPGYAPAEGAVGEYNGKFMVGQQVLRGGSCATAPGHVRASYRNFFPPAARWQFSGVRLARDLAAARTDGVKVRQLSAPPADEAARVAAGLLADPPTIASGNFYDQIGCRLFEAITDLPEYGLTRAEAAIFADKASEMADAANARLGRGYQLIDLGAGNCEKAERLLPLLAPSRYVAIDIAAGFLTASLERVQQAWPGEVQGLGMDFAADFALPDDLRDRPALFFYPGSSIGNFAPDTALAFLRSLKAAVPDSALLIGADLVRGPALLEAAYDDSVGVTAAFNRNVLSVLNSRFGTDFEPARWRHVARYDEALARIEMWLEANADMEVSWPGGRRHFGKGERILTEISTKWTAERLTALLESAGFADVRLWTSPYDSFAVALGG
jgi:dimethylhistidine N-methyltransferase